jgi:penicillin-binding protein 2
MSDFENIFTRRTFILSAIGGLGFASLALRMAKLQVFENSEYRLEAADNQFNFSVVPASRGAIYDRFGIPIAINRRDFRVMVIRDEFENTEQLFKTIDQIGTYFGVPYEKIETTKKEVKSAPRYLPSQIVSSLTWEQYSQINLFKANYPGVYPEMGENRNYPLGDSFAHIIGYVARANDAEAKIDKNLKHPAIRIGKEGLEKAQEGNLRGKHGARKLEVDAHNKIIREVFDPSLSPVSGEPIVLTIDAEMQQIAIDLLKGEAGALVALDIKTGEIMTMASSPTYDPNKFVDGIPAAEYKALLENERHPLYHKAIRGNYPAASTFKPLMSIAALEAGVIRADEHINCPGFIYIGNNKFHCAARRGHGPVNLHTAIKASCDVYYYEVGRRLGADKIAQMAKRFGLGKAWDIGLPGVSKASIPDPEWKMQKYKKPWHVTDTVNMSIGQGYVTITPMQLAIMATRIGAFGKEVEPSLIRAKDGTSRTQWPSMNIPEDYMKAVHNGMLGVTREGGGTATKIFGGFPYKIAGKTGTAQVRRISLEERKKGVLSNASLEWKLRDHSLFVCFGPAEDPKYACACIIEHGGNGAGAAAPRARDLMKALIEKDPGAIKPYNPWENSKPEVEKAK